MGGIVKPSEEKSSASIACSNRSESERRTAASVRPGREGRPPSRGSCESERGGIGLERPVARGRDLVEVPARLCHALSGARGGIPWQRRVLAGGGGEQRLAVPSAEGLRTLHGGHHAQHRSGVARQARLHGGGEVGA